MLSLRCDYCRGPKTPPKVKKHPANEHWEADPYCSRNCCEADHGIVDRGGMKAPVHTRERVA